MKRSQARRLKNTAVRVEGQPYDYVPKRRTPRLSSPSSILWCTPDTPCNSNSSITGQTLQVRQNGSLVNTNTNATIWNNYGAQFVAGKRCSVGCNPDGTYSFIAQSCT